MSLVNAYDVLPHLSPEVNNGIEVIKQLELDGRSSAPSDDDLEDGRIYYNSSNNNLYVRANSSWVDLTASASGISDISDADDTDISSVSSAQVLIYDGSNSWDNKSISGDVTLAADGSTTVTDLTISSEVAGDVLYFDGTNWVRLAKDAGKFLKSGASSVSWDNVSVAVADKLSDTFEIEGGASYDITVDITTQTSSAPTVTLPDLGGTNQEWVFAKASQTLTNKTLTTPVIAQINDTNGNEQIVMTATGSAVNYLNITNSATGNGVEMASAGGDGNVDLLLVAKGTGVVKADGTEVVTLSDTQTLTNKTLTAPVVADTGYIADGNGNEYLVFGETASAENHVKITNAADGNDPEVAAVGDDTNINLNLVGKGSGVVHSGGVEVVTLSGTQTLTNKTLTTPTINGVDFAYASKSGAYTATASDYVIDVSGASGGVTITLPTASGITGRVYVIKNSDASETVTIDGNSSETIDGSATVAMNTQYDFRAVMSDGTNWVVIASS